MKEEILNYSEVPHAFDLCAIENCPLSATCLRHIAYKCVPVNVVFLRMLNPRAINGATGKCKFYCSNKKVRYAKGFLCTTESLPVRASGIFRNRLVSNWGIRRYYQRRKGETLLPPAEQQLLVALAKELGVHQDQYFDGYVYEYKWD